MPSYPGIGPAVVQLVASPRRLFETLREDPRILQPLVLLALSLALLAQACFTGPFLNDVRAAFDRADIPSAQRVVVMERMSGTMGRLTALVPAVAAVVICLVLAVLFWLLFTGARSLSAGPPPRFRGLLSVLAHVGLIDAIGFLFKLPLMLTKGTLHVYSSAALLLSPDASESRLFKLLDSLDLFSIWKLWLVTVGFTIVTSRRASEVAAVVWGSWALFVLGKVVFSGILSPNVRAG